MKSNSSINYTACNIGSVNNSDNSSNCGMPTENRFKYNTAPVYTALPCYYHHPYGTYLFPSLNSSGALWSNIHQYWIYPAISTYRI